MPAKGNGKGKERALKKKKYNSDLMLTNAAYIYALYNNQLGVMITTTCFSPTNYQNKSKRVDTFLGALKFHFTQLRSKSTLPSFLISKGLYCKV